MAVKSQIDRFPSERVIQLQRRAAVEIFKTGKAPSVVFPTEKVGGGRRVIGVGTAKLPAGAPVFNRRTGDTGVVVGFERGGGLFGKQRVIVLTDANADAEKLYDPGSLRQISTREFNELRLGKETRLRGERTFTPRAPSRTRQATKRAAGVAAKGALLGAEAFLGTRLSADEPKRRTTTRKTTRSTPKRRATTRKRFR